MLKRRLYLQIYIIIIVSLLAVVVMFAIVGRVLDHNDSGPKIFDLIGKLAYLSLPDDNAPQSEQEEAIVRLSNEIGARVSLFDPETRLIASAGEPLIIPADIKPRRSWQRFEHGRVWILHLPDKRWLAAELKRQRFPPPVLRLVFFLGGISIVVALVAYPFVRRLTRRLELLQVGVEKIGAGDLSARVEVQGTDEVANLAGSFNDTAGKIETLLASHRLLLANASHELRTPLARIRLGVEMLNADYDQNRYEALQDDIKELDELIDEILLMSRLDAGANITLRSDVDIVALIAEECAHYTDCTLTGSAPTITGDEKLLRRLVRNLLQNAQTHGKPPIMVHLEHDKNNVILTVSDDGKGFDNLSHENAFQPFHRAADRQNIRGYGLGLALVRQIAEAHNGAAEIVSKDEMSSAVRVALSLDNQKVVGA